LLVVKGVLFPGRNKAAMNIETGGRGRGELVVKGTTKRMRACSGDGKNR